MMKEKPTAAGRILTPIEAFVIRWEGVDVVLKPDETRVREGHPILAGREHQFREIRVQYDMEQATAAPGEKRS